MPVEMKVIRIDNIAYHVPADWNEMTRQQVIALSGIVRKAELTFVEMQLKFLLLCISGHVKSSPGSGLFVIKTKKACHILFVDELASILTVFDWLFIEVDGSRELTSTLTVNHFKKVRCGRHVLYGPNDALDNITYDEFVWLQTWHSQIDSNPAALDELINVVYKTRKGKSRLKSLRRMPQEIKTGILWLYLGTLRLLEYRFPRVFSGSGSGDANVFDNQQRIIDVLSHGDVTKKMEVRSSLLYDALYSMEMAAIRNEELEKQIKK